MKDTLTKFIHKIGKEHEFRIFLDMIHNTPRYAVFKLSGQSIDYHLDHLAENIAFLNQLEIYPVIVHGAGSTLDERMPDSKKIDGLRVTGKYDIHVIKEVFDSISSDLEKMVNSYGGRACRVSDVFKCSQLEKYGLVGSVEAVNLESIMDIVDSGATPIISPLGSGGGSYLNINADTAAKELVKAIRPKKWVLVTEAGGVLDDEGMIVPVLNTCSPDHYHFLDGGMLYKVNELVDFVRSNPYCEVAVTSAENMLKEMFTIKGSGTLIKHHEIVYEDDMSKMDIQRISSVVSSAFSRNLVKGYFSDLKSAFYEKDYGGVALLKEIDGIPYLDKFAVAKHLQGTGLGESIWTEMINKYPKLIWRAKTGNPCNSFYHDQCHGMKKSDGWNFYYINLSDDEIIPCYEKVISKKETLAG